MYDTAQDQRFHLRVDMEEELRAEPIRMRGNQDFVTKVGWA